MNEPDHVIDVSEWDMWKGLIGSKIDFIYHDESHQVLELRGQNGSAYLSTQEQGSWLADVLHISNTLPIPSS
ncbi:hypothetical protein [Pseudoalteromonas sp.]|uniref:hypothetical protein n=1 Tax=Pseudoalteromonas sp. TaxID=53249 RepID=UPI001BCD48CE|nr:hypothetical protein [Pseudoalteromonas sp.]